MAIGIASSRERVKSREESEGEEVRKCTLKNGGSQEHQKGRDLGCKEESVPHCHQDKGKDMDWVDLVVE